MNRGVSDRSPYDETRRQLRRLKIGALKGLGQHFLIDEAILETIISAAEITAVDTVVEIGPGLGVLTERLLTEAGTVIAVEIDPKLASALDNRFASNPRLRTVNADILQLDPEKLFSEHGLITKPLPEYKVVANLPYYIASSILRHFLEASLKPVSMVIMVQKEVGQSIVAAPGGMSLLGISVQVYGKPEIIEYVPAQSFYPKPKVDSVIIRIEVYSKPAVDLVDISGFFGIVKAGFSRPRKQMRNSLSLGLGIEASEVEEILKIAGIDSKRRPQTLTIDEWVNVYRGFIGRGGL